MIYYYSIYTLNNIKYITINNKSHKIFDWDDKSNIGIIKLKDISNFEKTYTYGSLFAPLDIIIKNI